MSHSAITSPGRACGLSSNGSASVLAERLASHVAEDLRGMGQGLHFGPIKIGVYVGY